MRDRKRNKKRQEAAFFFAHDSFYAHVQVADILPPKWT